MTNQIVLVKSIPSSSWYSGTGSTSIPINAEEITVNTKKSLIKTAIPQSPNTQLGSGSDVGKSFIMDLKRVEDTIKIRGWLADGTGSNQSAWNRAWQLRSMCSSGNVGGDKGALNSLTIDNITMSSSTTQCFLEEVSFIAGSKNLDNWGNISQTGNTGIAKIQVDLSIYVGNPR
jgi:hypothetical protein